MDSSKNLSGDPGGKGESGGITHGAGTRTNPEFRREKAAGSALEGGIPGQSDVCELGGESRRGEAEPGLGCGCGCSARGPGAALLLGLLLMMLLLILLLILLLSFY